MGYIGVTMGYIGVTMGYIGVTMGYIGVTIFLKTLYYNVKYSIITLHIKYKGK